MSLYRKYRPKIFAEVVGQDFAKVSLAHALTLQKLAGAYLFYGSHGTGKTSIARIFAKGLNCLSLTADGNPCQACEHCRAADAQSFLDLIEIDGASYNGVDEVRDLIEKAKFQPHSGKYKIYIIDEVHMLSKSAFNALLKTLEEPPAHVKFLLATTEIDKIPDTILSRVLRYDFQKIPDALIVEQLKKVCTLEEIPFEPEALPVIARSAQGGMRDALTALEQLATVGTVTQEIAEKLLGFSGDAFLQDFFTTCVSGNAEHITTMIAHLKSRGTSPRQFLEESLFFLAQKMSTMIGKPEFAWWSRAYEICEQRWSAAKHIFAPDIVFDVLVALLLSPEKNTTIQTPPSLSRSSAAASASSSPSPVAVPDQKKHYFSAAIQKPESSATHLTNLAPKKETIAPVTPLSAWDILPAPETPKSLAPEITEVNIAPSLPAEEDRKIPVAFSQAAWIDALKKEGVSPATTIALKYASLEKKEETITIWANNTTNMDVLKKTKGALEVAYRVAFGTSVTLDIQQKQQPVDLASQAVDVFK